MILYAAALFLIHIRMNPMHVFMFYVCQEDKEPV